MFAKVYTDKSSSNIHTQKKKEEKKFLSMEICIIMKGFSFRISVPTKYTHCLFVRYKILKENKGNLKSPGKFGLRPFCCVLLILSDIGVR